MKKDKCILEVEETMNFVKEKYDELKQEILMFFNKKSIYSQLNGIARFVLVEPRDLNFKVNIEGGSFTDGKNVTVDVPWYMMDKSEEEILGELKANVGHEIEHINSSNFELLKKYMENASNYLKDNFDINKNVGKNIAHSVFNSIEDGRIEKILVNRLKGYLKYIKVMRANWWKYQPVTGDDEYEDAIFAICTIATTGLYPNNWGNVYDGTNAEEKIESIKHLIIDGINANTAEYCSDICMKILKELGEYFAELLGKDNEKSQKLSQQNMQYEYTTSQGGAGIGQRLPESAHFVSEDENKDKEDDKNSKRDDNENNTASNDLSGKAKANKNKDREDDKGGNVNESIKQNSCSNGPNVEGEDESNKDKKSSSESGNERDNIEGEDNSSSNESNSEKRNRSNKEKIKDKSKIDDFIKYFTEQIKEEMKNLLDTAKKEEIKNTKKKIDEDARRRLSELSENELDEIYEDSRENYPIEVVFNKVNTKNNLIVPTDVRMKGKRLRKTLEEILMNKKTETLRHRKRGIIDNNVLWRMSMDDYELFKKKTNYDDSDYVFYILKDGSGSMLNNDKNKTKWNHACESSAIIEEGLKGLIPFKVVMFNSSYDRCVHNIIKDFDDNSKENQCYNSMTNLQPDKGNKDGLSIRVATKELLKRTEKNKVLIVLSDGKPSAYKNKDFGYADVRNAVKEARKSGVKVLSIYLEDEKKREKEIDIYRKMYQQGIIACEPSKIGFELMREVKKQLL